MTWTRVLVAVAAVSLAFGAAVAHQGGTTGHATISVVGQSVRYALSLPAEGLGDVTRDLRELAAAVARHVTIEGDGAACSAVPAETRPPSAGRSSIEVVVLYACAAPMRNLSVRDGIDALLGVEHIIGGIDHLLFLLALLALTTSLWQTVKIVTAFTVAHSITLSLAVLGFVKVPPSIVEPLIAASIVWVAVENLVAPAGAARRWLVAGAFGLIHGLGFASMLVELGVPKDAVLRALVGFNIGVELGQLAFVAVVMPPLVWASRRVPRLTQILSVIVALVGAVWLVQRLLAV